MIFVLVIHGRKSIMKSVDFSKMTPTTTYSLKKTCVFAFYEKCIKKWNDFPMFFWQFSNMFWAMCDLTLQKPSLKWWFFSIKTFLSFFSSVFPRSESMNFFCEQWHCALTVEKHFRKIIKNVGFWTKYSFFRGFIGSNRSIFQKIQILLVDDFLLVFCIIFEGAFWHFGLTSKFCKNNS